MPEEAPAIGAVEYGPIMGSAIGAMTALPPDPFWQGQPAGALWPAICIAAATAVQAASRRYEKFMTGSLEGRRITATHRALGGESTKLWTFSPDASCDEHDSIAASIGQTFAGWLVLFPNSTGSDKDLQISTSHGVSCFNPN
jgi:hypothetical protein